ncbi:hypothetical protein CDAR_33251 [Caerostris darwini]|uniref:Uncharacterized protein n=1 Tax=Caerostris darwini TaxID=1538125 RepID=A0AAV4X3K2_9ARAC|nr:hypothetical protein CDAR_33251 [Caerostris darwini]
MMKEGWVLLDFDLSRIVGTCFLKDAFSSWQAEGVLSVTPLDLSERDDSCCGFTQFMEWIELVPGCFWTLIYLALLELVFSSATNPNESFPSKRTNISSFCRQRQAEGVLSVTPLELPERDDSCFGFTWFMESPD